MLMVAAHKYFAAKNVGGFVDWHVRDMASRNWPVAREFVEEDCLALEQLAEVSDAVRVIPAY